MRFLAVATLTTLLTITGTGASPLAGVGVTQNSEKRDAAAKKKAVEMVAQTTGVNLLDDQSRFRVGESVMIRVHLRNNSDAPLDVLRYSEFAQYRLRLMKDGAAVPYVEGLMKTLRGKDKEETMAGSISSLSITPGATARVDFIDLSRWYGSLGPGQYQLTLKRTFRFEKNGIPPIESNTVAFEVLP
jgi:hypothetical protein